MRFLFLSLLLLIASLEAGAQQLPIKTYTTADGLSHNSVNRIVKDSRGFLWFCTGEGLSRFDSYTFTNFGVEQGLPGSVVNDLLETGNGGYWVATDGGLARFDPTGRPADRSIESQGSHSTPMFTLVPDLGQPPRPTAATVLRQGRDGTIWVGTDNGLYRLGHAEGRLVLHRVEIGIPTDHPEQRIVADVL